MWTLTFLPFWEVTLDFGQCDENLQNQIKGIEFAWAHGLRGFSLRLAGSVALGMSGGRISWRLELSTWW